MDAPHVVVLGGPNGAGKSTVAPFLLRDALGVRTFVNADDIARGLAGFAPEAVALRAGRLMLERIAELTAARATFGFESTLAGLGVRDVLVRCRDAGYRITIVYVWLPSPELSLARIKRRVADGGHDVPERDVRRRWARSLVNFLDVYRALADTWYLLDGTTDRAVPVVAVGGGGETSAVYSAAVWTAVTAQAAALRQRGHP